MIPITKPFIGPEETVAIQQVLQSGWLSQGVRVAEFEQAFALAVGARYACAVSNCTTALYLALLAVGVKPGDQVITVSHSFIATANSIAYCGAVPVFVDVDPTTFNIDPVLVEAAITERTTAILCVHQLGMPCDLGALVDIAARYRLPLVEDAACAVGSEINYNGHWERIGKPHGEIACFSFHPRKIITTGEGGMLTTNNPDLDQQFRLLRQHCMSIPDSKRHVSAEVLFESYPALGFNFRLTDMQAALGCEQLKRLPAMVSRRRTLAARYRTLLAAIPGVQLPEEPEWARSNWQSFCVRLPADCGQKQVMQAMLDAGIATRRGVMCAHREPAYAQFLCSTRLRDNCGCAASCHALRHSEAAQEQTLLLPLFPQLRFDEQDTVVAVLREALAQQQGRRWCQ